MRNFVMLVLVALCASSCSEFAQIRVNAKYFTVPWDAQPPIVREEEKIQGGTAFYVSDNGIMLTAAHVLRGSTDKVVYVRTNTVTKKVVKAKILAIDWPMDMAVLDAGIPSDPVPPLCRDAYIGDKTIAYGRPDYGTPLARRGKVLNFTMGVDHIWIHSSSRVRPGFSGGPLQSSHNGEKCTLGVVTNIAPKGGSWSTHPIESLPVVRVLVEKAPEFLRNFDMDVIKKDIEDYDAANHNF